MGLFSYFKKVVKKEVIKNAELKIKDVLYVPAHTTLIPNYILGEFRDVIIPTICNIKIEYENEEYILNDHVGFYLKFLKDIEFPNDELIIKHDIIVKEYKNGKKEIDLYEEN